MKRIRRYKDGWKRPVLLNVILSEAKSQCGRAGRTRQLFSPETDTNFELYQNFFILFIYTIRIYLSSYRKGDHKNGVSIKK